VGDAQPTLCKLLLLAVVQHHTVRKPAVVPVPAHLPALQAGEE
jgi:hypothetical protein